MNQITTILGTPIQVADYKAAMKEIRESEWFGMATELGLKPQVKVSPHDPFGRGL